MKCQKCWKEIPDDSIFCPFCGETIASRQVSMNDNDQNLNVSSMVTGRTETVEQGAPTTKKQKKKSWIIISVLFLAVLLPSLWLYNQASHYASPFPQLNALCAKFISDYHDLRIGMNYSEVKGILGTNIVSERWTNDAKYIYTKEKLNFGFNDSDYEMCIFVDDKLAIVCIVFEERSINDDNAIDEHFSEAFGEKYHKSVVGNYYNGKSFDIEVEYTDYHSLFNLPVHTINLCFQVPNY